MRKTTMVVAAALLAGCGGGEEAAERANEAANYLADDPANTAAPEENAAAPEANAAAPAAEEPALNESAATAEEPAAEKEPAAPAEGKAPAVAAAPPPVAKVAQTATMDRPASFAMCQTCHSTKKGDPHRVGPNLHGVVGAKAGTRSGYNYSDAMKESGLVWTRDRLDAFIAAPRAVVPGTKMVIAGPKDAGKRQEIIDYLASLR